VTPKGIVVYEGPSALNGAPIVAIATNLKRPSANQKTGPVVQVWILPADVRPHVAVKSGADAAVCGDCKHRPSLEGTCYVPTFRAPGAVHAAFLRGSYARPTPSEARALLAGRVVRLGAWGDPVAVPLVVWRALLRDVKGWTGYTHQWRLPVARPYQALLMAWQAWTAGRSTTLPGLTGGDASGSMRSPSPGPRCPGSVCALRRTKRRPKTSSPAPRAGCATATTGGHAARR